SREAAVLKEVLDAVQPDFFFSLHNSLFGGAFYFLSRDIGSRYYQELYQLLDHCSFPLQKRPVWREVCDSYGEGVIEMFSVRKYYVYPAPPSPSPETVVHFGGGSWDYLAQIKPTALTFVAKMGYGGHPADDSDQDTGTSLRKFKLRLDADGK